MENKDKKEKFMDRNINIKSRHEHVIGSFIGEAIADITRDRYLDGKEISKKNEEKKEKVKRNIKTKNILLWPLYVIVGGISVYCYLSEIIPFFTIGIIIMLAITIALLGKRKSNLNPILFSVLSLIGIAFFWQFQMWWWLVGMIAYFLFIVFLSFVYEKIEN